MKLLFWIDDGHVLFGVAKLFQEKYDYELFAVYDVNYITKKFYKNQRLVEFKKSWFWRDSLSSVHKPDLDYLKDFEKKYNINLWTLAYQERKFVGYNEFHKFTHDEILSITEDECKIYEKIIDYCKPDFLIIGITDLHRNHLFKELCQRKGIKVLMYQHNRFVTGSLISSDYDLIDNFDKTNPQITANSKYDLKNYLSENNPREGFDSKFIHRENKLGLVKLLKRHYKFLTKICNDEFRKFPDHWGKTRFRFLLSKEFLVSFVIKRWYRKSFLDKQAKKEINPNEKFIYLPLHVVPDRSLLISATFYTNQPWTVEEVAKSIPVGYKVYVKEHFSMKNEAWRKISYYKQIMDLPNVELIHPSVDSKLLLENCSLVITAHGTSALEAGFFNKPSIVLADTSFDYLPFVKRIRSYEDLPATIRLLLNSKFDYSLISHYIELVEKNTFTFDTMEIWYDVARQIHEFNGLLRETEISDQKMQSFLESHQEVFQNILSAYIKKINQFDTKQSIENP